MKMEDRMIEDSILTYKILLAKYTTYQYQIDYVIDGDGTKYEHINWLSEKFDKPSKEKLDEKIESFSTVERNRYINSKRKSEYPTPEEWIVAYVQKEIDGQVEEWNSLIERRSQVRKKFFK